MRVAYEGGWDIDIERGPDWLFIKLHAPSELGMDESCPLAERMWELLRQNFARRLVLELDEIGTLSSYLLGQLVQLHKRLYEEGGILRISGVSPACEEVLRLTHQIQRLYPFANREEAVLGSYPNKPR